MFSLPTKLWSIFGRAVSKREREKEGERKREREIESEMVLLATTRWFYCWIEINTTRWFYLDIYCCIERNTTRWFYLQYIDIYRWIAIQ